MNNTADEQGSASHDSAKLSVTSNSEERALDNHKQLAQWVARHGGFIHPNLRLKYAPNKGYHGVVADGATITAHTRVVVCPISIMMSALNVLNIAPFEQHGTSFPKPFLQRYQSATDTLQAFFLMEQYLLGDKSFWAPYIRTLPTVEDVDAAQFEAEEDLAWIRGTNLEVALAAQNRKWLHQFEDVNRMLMELDWNNARNGAYDYRLFRWASKIFGTRSFVSTVLDDTAPADKARPLGRKDPNHQLLYKLFSERFAVLLPLLDILNHKPAALVEWQARVDFVGLQIDEDYTSGQEVFNNYGPLDNEALLMSYGFVLEDNPYEHVLISINAHPGTPLEIARTWPLDDRSNETFNCYIYEMIHHLVKESRYIERALFSFDLLDSISVMISNEREFQAMSTRRQTLMSSSLPEKFDDFRNMLATLAQIMYDSGSRARRIQATDPSRANPPIEARTQKQKNAQIYRHKQVSILQTAEGVCAFVLLNASTDQQASDLLLSMRVKLAEMITPGLEEFCMRLQFITRRNELFTAASLIRLFPSPQANSVQSCLRDIESAILEAVPHHMRPHSDKVKTSIAISLSSLCQAYRSRTQLPFRLASWFEEISSSYPPEDPNWNYVPPPGPWAPGEEPPQALMYLLDSLPKVKDSLGKDSAMTAWLDPEKVCWAWNVMEEEGVRVPIEIERFVSEDPAQVEGLFGFMIYCRQYD
ncbi:hypothetical protein LTR64_000494 [Lithohypha guttulata]|uniref:uncharacterized protein n=1 Tax=Lithohypha guttulata TaxID=1690604 RepID=UPI002DE05CE9|nr:hypothetical protein LTR51_005739 [Lithohypha guttulata]